MKRPSYLLGPDTVQLWQEDPRNRQVDSSRDARFTYCMTIIEEGFPYDNILRKSERQPISDSVRIIIHTDIIPRTNKDPSPAADRHESLATMGLLLPTVAIPVINCERLENQLGSILKETALKTLPDDLDPKPRKP